MSMNKHYNLGDKLKKMRKQNGFTIDTLREALCQLDYPVCAKTIYKWENNEISPEIKTLNLLASIYDTSIGSFFEERYNRQALSESELRFIIFYRKNNNFKKIILLITKQDKEEIKYGHTTIK